MTLERAIKQKKISEIRSIVKDKSTIEVVNILESLSIKEHILFFSLVSQEIAAKVFSHLDLRVQQKIVEKWTDKEMQDIINGLYVDDIADLIEDVPANIASRILQATTKDKRASVNKILRYTEHQTGSVMSVDIISFKQSLTPKKAIEQIKAEKEKAEMAHYLFVTDNKGKLVGEVSLENIVFASENKKIKDIMKPTFPTKTTTDKEVTAQMFSDIDKSIIPVVNNSGYLMGMITSDDIIDVIREEATEDVHKMAGIDGSISYSKAKISSLFKSRIFWLMFLMISSTISQIVLDSFQTISNNLFTHGEIWTTAMVAILPVISGAAGNAGSQSSSMIIRGLATGDIDKKDYFKIFGKEFRVSSLIGFTLAVVNFGRLLIYYVAKSQFDIPHVYLALAASISLMSVIILAKIVGGMLPLVGKAMKIDPAVMAAPILTTIIDALSTLIFFAISIGIMSLVL